MGKIFHTAGLRIMLPALFFCHTAAFAGLSAQTSVQIDISPLIPFYQTLTIDEKNEQARDWALYGLLAKLNISQKKMAEMFKGSAPLRFPYLKDSVGYKILSGRVEYLSGTDCIVLVQEENRDNKPLIGALTDKKYSATNYLPEKIHIYSYRADIPAGTITVSYYKTEPGKKLFGPEYGYAEKEVRNLDDFRQFMGNIDDILSMRWKDNSVTFAGRKYPADSNRSLTTEDIATLYQAYMVQVTPEKEEKHKHDYNLFINQKYEEVLKLNPGLEKAISRGKTKKKEVLDYIRQRIPYTPLGEEDENVGFSLDPGMDYRAVADDLEKLAGKDPGSVDTQDTELCGFIDSIREDIVSTAGKVRNREDLEPVLVLLRKYSKTENRAQAHFVDILKRIQMKNSYQLARYDGKMKGTSPAMVLFYTDLTAKLWALDFDGSAPRNTITGFRAMSEIRVPKLYWDDFVKLSKTRLWFGVKKDAFEVYGKKAVFEPVATRVYAASSDPLFPGKESKPNYQSGEFLGWWDKHYETMADFEPQYHKLNQIQKWSCILMILKEEKNRALDFLFNVSVERNLDYETWYRVTPYLKVKPEIAFIDKTKYNRTTECLPIFYSQNYPLMGQSFFLFGGVSLASKNDILGKLKKKTSGYAAKGGDSGEPSASGIPAAPGAKRSNRIGPPLLKAKTRQESSGTANTYTPSPLALEDKPSIKIPCRADGANYGELLAEKNAAGVKLSFEKGPAAIANDILQGFAEIQDARREGFKDERIFRQLPGIESAVRVENWKTYLIKSSAIKDMWLYVNLNEQEKKASYIAKAAGTEADSDSVYARLITQSQFDKLTKEKQTIKIF